MSPDESTRPMYTYFVIAPAAAYGYTEYDNYSYVTYEQAEGKLYSKMRLNGSAGSSGSNLGNLASAYVRGDSMAKAIPNGILIENIDNFLFRTLDYRFVTEDDMRDKISIALDIYTDCIDRKASYSQTGTLTNGYVVGSTGNISAPMVPLTYENYEELTQLSFDDFINHAKAKQSTNRIQVVFLPFMYRRVGTVSGTPFDSVYLCSVPGIYINGMLADMVSNPYASTYDAAPFDAIASLTKMSEIKNKSKSASIFVDIFDDLIKLEISNTLDVIPRAVYNKGITAVLYLKPYNQAMLDSYVNKTVAELEALNAAWDSSSFIQSAIAVWSNPRDVVYIEEVDPENPRLIANGDGYLVFEDRLVLWKGNKVFISEEGQYYYFTNILKKEFPEEILK